MGANHVKWYSHSTPGIMTNNSLFLILPDHFLHLKMHAHTHTHTHIYLFFKRKIVIIIGNHGCFFCTITAELGTCDRDCMAHKAKNIYCPALKEKYVCVCPLHRLLVKDSEPEIILPPTVWPRAASGPSVKMRLMITSFQIIMRIKWINMWRALRTVFDIL